MSTPFWNVLRVSPALVGASFLITSSVYAKEGTPEPTTVALSEAVVELETQDTASFFQPSEIERSGNLENGTLITQMPEADATAPETTGILEQVDRYNNNEFIGEPETVDSSMEQVTNVSQLSDVSPGDWAFEALRSLVERYGCIAGYPDGTYRGNRAMTRYEFAAGLNACLQQIESLIAGLDFVTREDLETLQRLIQEFEAELATLGTRVDNLEGRVAFLEDNQFSTTTKLNGEAIFSLAGSFGDERAIDADDDPLTFDDDVDDEITFSDRVRIAFDTSFFGRDRLRTRFEAGNVPEFDESTGTEMARLGYEAANGNDVEIEKLHYRFPVGDNLRFHIGATGVTFDDIASPNNPFFESSGSGALGRFLRRNPAIYRNGGSITAGANIRFTDFLSLDLAYLTSGDGNDPTEKNGLTNGDFTAIGQLNLGLGDNIDLAFSYGYSYYPGEDVNLSGSTSGDLAKRPFISDFNLTGDPIFAATSANRFGFQASVRLTSFLNIAGWVGYVDAEAESGDVEGADADIWNGAVILSFLDLGKEGAVFSIGGGIPPKLTDIDDPSGLNTAEDEDTSYIIEAQYQYPITDNILITPGAYVILNPNHNDDNENIYVGVIRTTFSF